MSYGDEVDEDLGGPHPRGMRRTGRGRGSARRNRPTDHAGALHDIRLIFHDTECVALLGAPGAGQNTLLRLLNGQLRGWSGAAFVLGQALSHSRRPPRPHRRRVGLLAAETALCPHRTVAENVMLGRLGHQPVLGSLIGRTGASDRRIVAEAMAETGIDALAVKPADALAAEDRRAVALARVLAQEPRLLLADPCAAAGPDPRGFEAEGFAHLCQIARHRRIPLIAACRHPDLALRHADRVVLMRGGAVALNSSVDALSAQDRAQLMRASPPDTTAPRPPALRLVV
ncbi:MAG: ATP-binding cassette domain-containing protein [Pseudomonadota bacterium]